MPEDEDVLQADLLGDLDVGPIPGPYRQGAIQRELHVPCAGGFGARGRDLLREVRGWHDLLGE